MNTKKTSFQPTTKTKTELKNKVNITQYTVSPIVNDEGMYFLKADYGI